MHKRGQKCSLICHIVYDGLENEKDTGALLAEEVSKGGSTITWIAGQAGYSRSAYYRHIRNPNLSLKILEKYGRVIGYDFSVHFPKKMAAEGKIFTSYDDLKKELDYWRGKYTELVKAYDELKAAYKLLEKDSTDQE